MLDDFLRTSVAMRDSTHQLTASRLLRADKQEDLCFALWTPSRGSKRLTALVRQLIWPTRGERFVQGNVSFASDFFCRALERASQEKCGLALMHSHLGPGWQGLSGPDRRAESSHAGAVIAATGLPFVGMTVGTDEAWSARFWKRIGPRDYQPVWSESVRISGALLRATFHPDLRPAPVVQEQLKRTIGVWGVNGQAQLSRLHVGIVGLGSVGSLVCECLARMGFDRLTLIDYDTVEKLNLDRIVNACPADIGKLKIDVAGEAAARNATAQIDVERVAASVAEETGYRAALGCDVLFSCVDRHWPRRVLNHVAYAHLIPVIDGGILVSLRKQRLVGADWHVHTVGPERKCLECWGAFDPSVVALERDGFLQDSSYIQQLDPSDALLRHENVFPFSMAVSSLEILQLAALVLGPIYNYGDQNYHFVTGELDRTVDEGCSSNCQYVPLTGTGDEVRCPTGDDPSVRRKASSR